MGLPVEEPLRATYADLEAVPSHQVAEILGGVLHVFPRPAPPHAFTGAQLGMEIGPPFARGRGGPGGWHILFEPELHLGPADDEDILVPDIAGWRVERMPEPPTTAYFTLAPDWVCEILSPRTEAVDRIEKMPIYAREGVRHAWLIHPIRRTLEVFALDTDGRWKLVGLHRGDVLVRAAPFDAIDLDLRLVWPPGSPKAEMDEGEEPPPPKSSRPKRSKKAPKRRKG